MARPSSTYVSGVGGWKDGQPTDDNRRYAGTHYEEGKGWCNSQGEQVSTKAWNGERLYNIETHTSDNPNIPAGYRRVAIGVPCPVSGSEDCVVRYSVNGEAALWDNGDVYMRR